LVAGFVLAIQTCNIELTNAVFCLGMAIAVQMVWACWQCGCDFLYKFLGEQLDSSLIGALDNVSAV